MKVTPRRGPVVDEPLGHSQRGRPKFRVLPSFSVLWRYFASSLSKAAWMFAVYSQALGAPAGGGVGEGWVKYEQKEPL